MRNQPLRSMNHTSLGLSAAANGSLQGAAWRRRFRRRTSSTRSRTSPAVLRRRPRALRLRRTQPRHHLLRSPVWVGSSYLDQPLGYCQWRPIRATTRSSAPVSKSLPAILLEPILTLVPRLAAYPKLPTQRYEAHFPSLPSFNELSLLFLTTRLFPGQHTPPNGFHPFLAQCVTHVPGLSLTNIPGLYPFSIFLRWGKRG